MLSHSNPAVSERAGPTVTPKPAHTPSLLALAAIGTLSTPGSCKKLKHKAQKAKCQPEEKINLLRVSKARERDFVSFWTRFPLGLSLLLFETRTKLGNSQRVLFSQSLHPICMVSPLRPSSWPPRVRSIFHLQALREMTPDPKDVLRPRACWEDSVAPTPPPQPRGVG